MADKSIKLADFGLSIDATSERPVTRAGTLDYMAPEVCTAVQLSHSVCLDWHNKGCPRDHVELQRCAKKVVNLHGKGYKSMMPIHASTSAHAHDKILDW